MIMMTGKFVKGAWVEDEVQSKLGDFSNTKHGAHIDCKNKVILKGDDFNFSPIVCDKDSKFIVSYDEFGNLVRYKIIPSIAGDVDNYSEYKNKLENLSDKYCSDDKPIGCKENERIAGNYTLFEMLQMKLFGKIFT